MRETQSTKKTCVQEAYSSFVNHYKKTTYWSFSFNEVEIVLITHAESSHAPGICKPSWLFLLAFL